jgi:eukaryotic-like serine/threonine-protein kinase
VAIFETEELDVEVSISGKPMGRTPGLTLRGMAVGKDYSFVARKPGFKTVSSKFRSDGQATITIPLAMEKLATATPPGTTATPAGTAPGTGTAPKKLERGELACATRPQGAQIFVDGKATGRTTPATPSNPIKLYVGRHKITFKLGAKSVDKVVEIKANQLETLTNIEL